MSIFGALAAAERGDALAREHVLQGLRLCALCGLTLRNDELCSHHSFIYDDDWATANRIMCDFFHRGIVPARLHLLDRDDVFWVGGDA